MAFRLMVMVKFCIMDHKYIYCLYVKHYSFGDGMDLCHTWKI